MKPLILAVSALGLYVSYAMLMSVCDHGELVVECIGESGSLFALATIGLGGVSGLMLMLFFLVWLSKFIDRHIGKVDRLVDKLLE